MHDRQAQLPSEQERPPRIKRWSGRLILLAIALAISGTAAEIVLRMVDPDVHSNRHYHPLLGWTQPPSRTFRSFDVQVEFNSLGFRDVEHTVEKPHGVKRIAVIGDSFCEALQVNLRDTFFKVLERKLNEAGTQSWEAINLGVGDFGTAQEYLALEHYGFAYSPDLVICEVFPLNDMINNSLELCGLASAMDRFRPYYVEENGDLRLTWQQPIRNLLRRHSLLYRSGERLLGDAFHLYQRKHGEAAEAEMEALGLPPVRPAFLFFLPHNQEPRAVQQAWHVTELLLKKLRDLCQQHAVPIVFVVVPYYAYLSTQWDAWVDTNCRRLKPFLTQDYLEKRLAFVFQRLGSPAVILKDVFEQHLSEVLPYVNDHLGVGGHRVMAEALWQKLKEIGIADS